MALLISATDLAIAVAAKADELRLVERPSRFGGTVISIEDAHGVIEVQDSLDEAKARVASILERLA